MVPIQNIRDLPTICGLYLVLNRDHKVVYIGQSKNIQERWKTGHHKLSDIINNYGTNVKIIWVEIPQNRLNHAEYLAIKFYNPHLNKKMPPIV